MRIGEHDEVVERGASGISERDDGVKQRITTGDGIQSPMVSPLSRHRPSR